MKKKILIIILWLFIWQFLSFVIHNSILLVGPVETFRALGEMVRRRNSGKAWQHPLKKLRAVFFWDRPQAFSVLFLHIKSHYSEKYWRLLSCCSKRFRWQVLSFWY